MAQVRHPGIVSVFDVGIDASGRCFIVSDYLKGDPLHKWLKEHRPTWQQSVSIVAAVADALAHAHAERTVHRDFEAGEHHHDGRQVACGCRFRAGLE